MNPGHRTVIWALSFVLAASVPADAHKASDSYLAITVAGTAVTGQWDIALRDLDYAIGLDENGDARITWGEVRARAGAVRDYAFDHLRLSLGDLPCTPVPRALLIDRHSDGAYAILRFATPDCATAPENAVLQTTYGLFFDVDPQHRGLVTVRYERATELHAATGYEAERGALAATLASGAAVTIFSPEHASASFERSDATRADTVVTFVRSGVWHIWTGFDHVLFLLSLLLPAVARRTAGRWEPAPALADATADTVKIVTAFTVAHSITLSVAALGLVDLPSRLVESTIALSVAIAAANNLVPIFDRRRTWQIAFVFGLVHGFGFASILADVGLAPGAIALALVSFNVGVELGQLAIVAILLPPAFLLRRTAGFRWVVLTGGSVAIVLVALGWLGERALHLRVF